MSDPNVEAMKRLYDAQVQRGLTKPTRATHTWRSAECVHDRHLGCMEQCRYCPAPCDCPCHTVEAG